MFIPDPGLVFFSMPDPGSKGQKAPDPGSGSVKLHLKLMLRRYRKE
jgi:hypothetical protein